MSQIRWRWPLAVLMALSLISCAQLGLAPAKTVDQKLAYAYGMHTALQNSAAQAVQSQAISQAEGRSILGLADNARTLLDSAKEVEAAGDTKAADQKLSLATAILTQVQNYLSKRGSS